MLHQHTSTSSLYKCSSMQALQQLNMQQHWKAHHEEDFSFFLFFCVWDTMISVTLAHFSLWSLRSRASYSGLFFFAFLGLIRKLSRSAGHLRAKALHQYDLARLAVDFTSLFLSKDDKFSCALAYKIACVMNHSSVLLWSKTKQQWFWKYQMSSWPRCIYVFSIGSQWCLSPC